MLRMLLPRPSDQEAGRLERAAPAAAMAITWLPNKVRGQIALT